MPCTPRIPAEFVGWSTQQLQAELTAVQTAISQLTSGAKPESVAYTQGDGSKSVGFTRAQLPFLQARVQTLAGILYPGQGYGRRRPARPLYLR